MYHKVKESLSATAMLLLMPLAISTARIWLGAEFPTDLAIGTVSSIIVFVWFGIRSVEHGTPYIAIAAGVFQFGIGVFAHLEQHWLFSGYAWLFYTSVWLLLGFWVSFGTLLGKERLKPVTS